MLKSKIHPPPKLLTYKEGIVKEAEYHNKKEVQEEKIYSFKNERK